MTANVVTNYINGELVPSRSGETLTNIEPATGRALGALPDSDEADLDTAIAAAREAFAQWSVTAFEQRAEVLNRIAALIERDLDRFARAESDDTGKPLTLARQLDIPRAIANLRFFAAAITQFHSESHATAVGAINYTLRQPLGIVGCISPWNLPLYLLTWKIAPALAAGNCVLAKPSELTPGTAHLLGEICVEAGLPPGVLNILHGRGAGIGQKLVEAPSVRAISFTGWHGHRPADRQHGGTTVQTSCAGARRQEPDDHLRRCRPRCRRGADAGCRVSKPGAGLPVRVAHPDRAPGVRTRAQCAGGRRRCVAGGRSAR
jgi:aminomuconate-semialdehyde/2-hydroxymuconate-6-semialdehyde dehydrogenase